MFNKMLPYDPVTSVLGIQPKEMKTYNLQKLVHEQSIEPSKQQQKQVKTEISINLWKTKTCSLNGILSGNQRE